METPQRSRPPVFEDRYHAGRLLAEKVAHLKSADPIVLALPRGGVPLGYEVAKVLDAPLDLLLVRKVPAPNHPEESLGVMGEGGTLRLDDEAVRDHRVGLGDLDEILLHEREEVERQVWRYLRGRPRISVKGRLVLLVDDGASSGRTAKFAVEQVRKEGAVKVLLGLGVVSPQAYPELFRVTDGVYSALVPGLFHSIAEWYRNFDVVPEGEIERLLQEVHHLHDRDALPVAEA